MHMLNIPWFWSTYLCIKTRFLLKYVLSLVALGDLQRCKTCFIDIWDDPLVCLHQPDHRIILVIVQLLETAILKRLLGLAPILVEVFHG